MEEASSLAEGKGSVRDNIGALYRELAESNVLPSFSLGLPAQLEPSTTLSGVPYPPAKELERGGGGKFEEDALPLLPTTVYPQ